MNASTVTVAASSTWPFDCNAANSQISALRGNDISNGVDNHTHYIALVSNGGGYMRGCASGVPSSPDPGTVASAPTGPTSGANQPVNDSGDTDGSFGDWYGGHELGHTFGRAHPGFCNGNSADDPSFPYPNGQISDNQGDDTGLDVGDKSPLPLLVLAGASHFDIMTYCNQPQWLSAYTYEGVRGRLLAENGESDSGAGPAGSRLEARVGESKPFVHVVASVDLTGRTAKIRYVTPVNLTETPAQPAGGQRAQIRVLDTEGQLLQSVDSAIRPDTDIPRSEHQTGLIDVFVPSADRMGSVTLHSNPGIMLLCFNDFPGFHYTVIALKSRTFVLKARTEFG